MKQRFSELTIGQKILVGVQPVLILLFLILYLTVGRMEYINFRGDHLRLTTEGQTMIYSGQVDYKDVSITVAPDQSVHFLLDGTEYGPYTIVEDPTAVPVKGDGDLLLMDPSLLTGVEIQHQAGGKVLFRGGYRISGGLSLLLFDEDGLITSIYDTGISDSPKPSEILRIALNPEPTARGHIAGFLFGTFLCLLTVFSILYADELFRHNLRFRIRNVEDAEPSEWELFSRGISWFVFTIGALVLYIMGLNNF